MVDVSSSCADMSFIFPGYRVYFGFCLYIKYYSYSSDVCREGMFGNYRQVFVDAAGILAEPTFDCIILVT